MLAYPQKKFQLLTAVPSAIASVRSVIYHFKTRKTKFTMEKFHFKGLMCPTLTAFTEDK